MTKEEAIATIRRLATPAVLAELEYWLQLDREAPGPGEAPYDLEDALADVSAAADDTSYGAGFDLNLRDIQIAIGDYVVVLATELACTVALSAGRPAKGYDFIRRGQKYRLKDFFGSDDQ